MEFNLKKINSDNLYILKNLFQLYIHDISKELSWNVNDEGLFEAYSLDDWYNDNNNFGYIIYVDDKLAGFVMIDKEFKILENKKESLNLSEIFILNNYKGKKLATNVALKIFEENKVKWEVRPVPMSKSAYLFWENLFTNNFPYKIEKHEWKVNRFAFTFSNL